MQIAIDASSANKEARTGVEWYAFHVIEGLKSLVSDDDEVVLYTDTPLGSELGVLPDGWSERVLEWSLPFGWMKGCVSIEMMMDAPDVLFVPSQGLPYFAPDNPDTKKKTVTTLHDVGFRRFPGLYERSVRRRLERVTSRAVKKASQILTVSEFSKRELVDLYDVNPERITVTHLAVDREMFRPVDDELVRRVMERHDITGPYFLSVGRLEKKKNITTLIRAFEQFKKNRGYGDEVSLVLAGTPGFGFSEIKQTLENSRARDCVHLTGYLPTDEIVALMTGALAYVFPSKYEGFGLPNLEAMACDTPLITADIPPHREVVEEAGVFVSPNDPAGWAMAMRRILDEDGLSDALIDAGRERLDKFSWKKTAQDTYSVLRGEG
jgi:glycosyltransferase involved in cell wall biosynthesis